MCVHCCISTHATDSNTSTGMICRRFWHATLRLLCPIHRHHPPQRAVLSQICCFGERKVVLFRILLDGAEPCGVGTTWCKGVTMPTNIFVV